ncbi:galactokinase [Cellulosilyticum sp. I15G10I2]|uniref:galactokinase n=1 Tax=Cellulosilyticum sp. I15G10I2 TaxID=1892843 RepID=UPI00085BED63|nr:galactokinase [Cellulosilyticum sp. I15G10I2]
MDLSFFQEKFTAVFETRPKASFFAPGRVNLIGEHIDYNGGLVFPCAITLGTYGSVSKRSDKLFRVYSLNFESLGIIEFSLDDLAYNSAHNWCNYLKGVLKYLLAAGHTIDSGLNIAIFGNIPNGSGLSSSASLEILMCKICTDIYDLNLSSVEAALLGKKVENEYIGVNSGIMDQFAIALGKEEHALLLDCNTQKYQHIPFQIEGYSIVIMNTNKRRELADSKYNERRSECESALLKLKKSFNIQALCDLKEENLDEAAAIINHPTEFKRVKHTITENTRVIAATKALEARDLITFGKLLNASHLSLKDDYEVTGRELDTLAQAAWNTEGVLGARMTGAGFGGCAIALVADENVEIFIEKVNAAYTKEIGYEASFYIASIGNGPKQIH